MPIINGIKYACEPCMRGHRSSKCIHADRLLVRVRKPGRPLGNCPHIASEGVPDNATCMNGEHGAAAAPCDCEVTSLAIPKVSTCECSIAKTTLSPRNRLNRSPISGHPKAPGTNPVSNQRTVTPPLPPTTGFVGGRISKNTSATIAKRRKKSVSAEAVFEIVLGHKNGQNKEAAVASPEGQGDRNGIGGLTPDAKPHILPQSVAVYGPNGNGIQDQLEKESGPTDGLPHGSHETEINGPDSSDLGQTQCQHSFTQSQLHQPTPVQAPSSPSTPVQRSYIGCCTSKSQVLPIASFIETPQFSYASPTPLPMPQFHHLPFQLPSLAYSPYSDAIQPIATTIYTYPNGYTTVNHPLTPEELMALQAQENWMSAAHACSCGPKCNCLGCAAHPYNARTLDWVRSVREVMHENAVPEYQQVVGGKLAEGYCGGRKASNTNGNTTHGNFSIQPMDKEHSVPPCYDVSASPPPQTFPPSPNIINPQPAYIYQPSLSNPNFLTFTPEIDDEAETDQNVLSPSGFFHLDYSFGICSQGKCLCGDSCNCLGCVVHARNNVVGGNMNLSINPLDRENRDNGVNDETTRGTIVDRYVSGDGCGGNTVLKVAETEIERSIVNLLQQQQYQHQLASIRESEPGPERACW